MSRWAGGRTGRGERLAALAVLLGVSGFIGGCGTFGERLPDAAELREEGREAARSGYTYGHGTGATPEEARQSALYEIAGEVVTAIRGEQREVFRRLERRGEASESEVERATELELTATVASISQVVLEGARVESERRVEQGWYVRVRLDDRRMETLREQARRHAPALAQFELTEAVPEGEPGRRFIRAARGLETVARTGVRDERLYSPERGQTTFGAYFEAEARAAVERLQLIPVVADGEVRFVVVDRETLRPQPGLGLRIAGRTAVTDEAGQTGGRRVGDLPREVAVEVLGAPGQAVRLPAQTRRLATLQPRAWADADRATLYVHTAPAEAVIQINGREYVTPARVAVAPGETYTVRVYGTETYRSDAARVRVGAGSPAAYHSVRLTERQFGYLDLAAEGRNTRLRLESHDDWEAGAIQREAEAGRYAIRVTRDDPRYQDIIDELVLRPDERIRRRYVEPRDRQPYHYGWRWALTLGQLGGEPGDAYRLPGEAGSVAYGDRHAIAGVERLERKNELNLQLGGQGQYFADRLPVTVSGGLGYRLEPFEVRPTGGGVGDEEVDLTTVQVYAGVGLWQPVAGGQAWITANQAWERSRWGSEGDVDLPGGWVSNDYAFAEVGGQWGGWAFGARLADGDSGLGPLLWVGFGATDIHQGYRRSPETRARPGVDYE